MKTISYFFSIALASSASLACGQTVAAHPLSAWKLIAADSVGTITSLPATLPPGAQMARPLPSGRVIVTAVTRPVFADEPEEWPVLELGQVAVLFSRQGDAGQVLVVVGDDPPVVVPAVHAIGPDGRSLDPLTISLEERQDQVVVAVDGPPVVVTSQSPVRASRDLVFSSGANVGWKIDSLEIESLDPGVDEPVERATGASSQEFVPAASFGGTMDAAKTGPGIDAASASVISKSVKAASETAAPLRGLEIFTPSSVRLGHADRLRAQLSTRSFK